MKFAKVAILLFAVISLCAFGQIFAKGGGTETSGNNLSLPVIWAEGKALDLRGTMLQSTLDGPYWTDEFGVKWYYQQEDLNYWQAENVSGAGSPVQVSWIDFADNMESQTWTLRSQFRTEVVLFQDLTTPMIGYEMQYLWGEGPDEMWGTNGVQYPSSQATVFSWLARYTIQKLNTVPYSPEGLPLENSSLGLNWNGETHQWDGPTNLPLYNSAVWEAEGVDGRALASIYSAELNIPGKVIYGYNWNLRKLNEGAGYYRITFSLDPMTGPDKTPVACNAFFTEGVTQIVPPPQNIYTGVIDYGLNLVYIDVKIVEK